VAASVRYALRDGVDLVESGRDLLLRHPWGSTVVREAPPALSHALEWCRAARPGGLTEAALAAAIAERGRPGSSRSSLTLPMLLARVGHLLLRVIEDSGRPLLRLEPIAAAARLPVVPPIPSGRVRLSRFAVLHAGADAPALVSPLSLQRAVLLDPRVGALVVGLGSTAGCDLRDVGELPEFAALGTSPAVAMTVVGWLVAAGLLAVARDGKRYPEDAVTAAGWEPHDLLFWWRSRPGRHDGHCGKRPAWAEPGPEVGMLAAAPEGATLPLPAADLGWLRDHDTTLTTAIENRVSVRSYGAAPITVRALGEFLYRTARLRTVRGTAAEPTSDRPYPSAGARHELEVYPVVGRVAGLASGVYHYLPDRHELEPIAAREADINVLLRRAAHTAGSTQPPDVLLALTARFGRVARAFQGIAYSLTLRNVGVLYQTMYLVATAMGLAPCALGYGDTVVTARALGLDLIREVPVGEFLLGSHPTAAAQPPDAPGPAPDEAGGSTR
jgi:SagB-type dehydrogenase family enzyme